MDKYHQEVLEILKNRSSKIKVTKHSDTYHGNSRPSFNITVPETRIIAREWITKHRDINLDEFIVLLNSLYNGKSTNEKSFGGKLLGYLLKLRRQIEPKFLDGWLENLEGWGEIDSLCQSNFTAEDMLKNWNQWDSWTLKWSKDKNISKKRASLVLLTGPVGSRENDQRIVKLAFEVLDNLKSERDVLITKAISWLLRSLITHNKNRVEEYLNKNIEILPKIAVRETQNKLRTG